MVDDRAFADWRSMLESSVAARGGPAEIADRLCRISGRRSAQDFETARRNIANWMSGHAVPQRRNFKILTEALGLAGDAGQLARWNSLYVRARGPLPAADQHEGAPAAPAVAATHGRTRVPRWIGGAAIVAAACLAAAVAMSPSSRPAADDSRTIGYLPFAELKAGESVLIHAKRGACGAPAPDWREFEHQLPDLKTGRLVDGGPGMSRSTTCGGVTPGRLVRYVAETPGDEVFELFERRIRVVVHD